MPSSPTNPPATVRQTVLRPYAPLPSVLVEEPYPGSDDAVAAGCTCPVDDNDAGVGWRLPDGSVTWDVKLACPLHGPASAPVWGP